MKYLMFGICCLLVFGQQTLSQPILSKSTAETFFEKITKGNTDLSEFVLAEDLAMSKRLGITYDRAPNKFLIQNDIDPKIRRLVRLKRAKASHKVEPLVEGYSKFIYSVPEKEYEKAFFFKGDKLISRANYTTRDWQRVSTRFFSFIISHEADYNTYAVSLLEAFVEEMFVTLAISPADQEVLEREKIVYILCHSTDEMAEITGVANRGEYMLSHDQIISTFNCHRHEVAHLLMNYKLKRLPLYTHHLLQEGFACAFGGRGDKDPAVILNLGVFLQGSEFMDYNDLLAHQTFVENDPSLSYPLSGIYNRFLMAEWGLEKYLKFYLRHSGDSPDLSKYDVKPSELPPTEALTEFLSAYEESVAISFAEFDYTEKPMIKKKWGRVWDGGDQYHFMLKKPIRLRPKKPLKEFQSQEYQEMFPDDKYKGEKYILEVTDDEVKLFNFYTATLVVFYAKGLSLEPQDIRNAEGEFQFTLKKSVFDEDISKMKVIH